MIRYDQDRSQRWQLLRLDAFPLRMDAEVRSPLPHISVMAPEKVTLARDWSTTPLGPPSTWPVALRTLCDVIDGSAQPMFIVWGAQRILLYNQPYATILADKHPAAHARVRLPTLGRSRRCGRRCPDAKSPDAPAWRALSVNLLG